MSVRTILQILLILAGFFISDYLIFKVLEKGIERYYGFNKDAQILLIGHSHVVVGLDASRIQAEIGVPVSKYAMAGANVLDRYWMIRHFVGRNPNVRLVIYDVDNRLFDTEGLSSASYTLLMPLMDDPNIAEYVKQEASKLEYYTSLIVKTSRFRDQTLNIAIRGLTNNIENRKSGTIRKLDYAGYLANERKRGVRLSAESFDMFIRTLEFLAKEGVPTLLVMLPVTDLINEIEPVKQNQVIRRFRQEAANRNSIAALIEFDSRYQSRYDMFFDPRHLNMKGNEVMTSHVIDAIRSLDLF